MPEPSPHANVEQDMDGADADAQMGTDAVTDAALMLRFGQGDASAFEELIERHQSGLFNFFYRLVGDRATAEDYTQDVLIRLYTHAERYVHTAKFTTYLYRVAKNYWIDHLRRVKRRGRTQSLDKETAEGYSLHDRLAAETAAPDEGLIRSDRARAVREAVASLPEEQRLVVILSEVQGMKYAEIAETLEIPVGTVKSRMHVAMNRLREHLTRLGVMADT